MKFIWLSGIVFLIWGGLLIIGFPVIFTIGKSESDIYLLFGGSFLLAVVATIIISKVLVIKRVSSWNMGKLKLGSLLMAIGHLGLLICGVLIFNAETGSFSGLMLLFPLLWSAIFYSMGALVGIIGIVSNA